MNAKVGIVRESFGLRSGPNNERLRVLMQLASLVPERPEPQEMHEWKSGSQRIDGAKVNGANAGV